MLDMETNQRMRIAQDRGAQPSGDLYPAVGETRLRMMMMVKNLTNLIEWTLLCSDYV